MSFGGTSPSVDGETVAQTTFGGGGFGGSTLASESAPSQSMFGGASNTALTGSGGSGNLFRFGTQALSFNEATEKIQETYNLSQDLRVVGRFGRLTTYDVADLSAQLQVLIEPVPTPQDARRVQDTMEEYCRLASALGQANIGIPVGTMEDTKRGCFLMNLQAQPDNSMLAGLFMKRYKGTLEDFITNGNGLSKSQADQIARLIQERLFLSLENGVVWYYLDPHNIVVEQGFGSDIVDVRFNNLSPRSVCVGQPIADKAKLGPASAFRCRQQALGTQRELHLGEMTIVYRLQLLLLMIKLLKSTKRRIPFYNYVKPQIRFLQKPKQSIKTVQQMLAGEKGGVAQSAMRELLSQLKGAVGLTRFATNQTTGGSVYYGVQEDSSTFLLTLYATLATFLENRTSYLSEIDLFYTSSPDSDNSSMVLDTMAEFVTMDSLVDPAVSGRTQQADIVNALTAISSDGGVQLSVSQGARQPQMAYPRASSAAFETTSVDWLDFAADDGDDFGQLPDPTEVSMLRYALSERLTVELLYQLNLGWPPLTGRRRKVYLLRMARGISNLERDSIQNEQTQERLVRIMEALKNQLGESWSDDWFDVASWSKRKDREKAQKAKGTETSEAAVTAAKQLAAGELAAKQLAAKQLAAEELAAKQLAAEELAAVTKRAVTKRADIKRRRGRSKRPKQPAEPAGPAEPVEDEV